MSNKIEIESELLRDLVDAAGYVSTFYAMFINHETPENCGDLNATEYLASEALSIAERGRAVLEAVEQKDALDAALPSCPMCESTDPEHFHVKRTWLNPAAPVI